jgi:hypothetical protein
MELDADSEITDVLPLDPDALASTIRVLSIAEKTVRAPTSADTIDGLLTQVALSFHDFIAQMLGKKISSDETSAEFGVIPSLIAGIHARTVADLLAFAYLLPDGEREPAPDNDTDYRALSDRWQATIIAVCCRGEQGLQWCHTPVAYVCIAASSMAQATRTLREHPQVSLDPDDRSPYDEYAFDLDAEKTANDAAATFVRCAAYALCTAAGAQSGFRFDPELLQP